MFPGNLQLSRKCFQENLIYRDNFINYCDIYLAISWQKYATIVMFGFLSPEKASVLGVRPVLIWVGDVTLCLVQHQDGGRVSNKRLCTMEPRLRVKRFPT